MIALFRAWGKRDFARGINIKSNRDRQSIIASQTRLQVLIIDVSFARLALSRHLTDRGITCVCPQGMVPAVTSELFGLNTFATNYAIIMLGPAVGAQQNPRT